MHKLGKLFYFVKGFINAKRSQRLTKDQIRARQKKMLVSLQRKVLELSPFYCSFSRAEFIDIPITDKYHHMKNFSQINTRGLDRDKALQQAIRSETTRNFEDNFQGFSVGLSSGTTGSRGLFVVDEKEQTEWAGYIWGKLMPLSIKKQSIAFFLRANNNLYRSIDSKFVQFNYFDLLISMDEHIARLNNLKPSILIAPARVLEILANQNGTSLFISPVRVISVAEVLDEDQKVRISNGFSVKVDEVYQATEGFLAATCHEGNLHLNEDQLIIEKQWVDETSGRFMPIVTDLKRRTQPVIRYQLDDILVINKEKCPCGSQLTRLEKIEGRQDDSLFVLDKNHQYYQVFPDFIRNSIISSSEKIDEYQVKQLSSQHILVAILPNSIEIQQAIEKGLQQLFERLSLSAVTLSFDEYTANPLHMKQRRIVGLRNE